MSDKKTTINVRIEMTEKDWSHLSFEEKMKREDNDIWQYNGKLYVNDKEVSYVEGGSPAYIIQELSEALYKECS